MELKKTKKKKSTTGRQLMTISVPYEIRKRMCAVGDGVNWSDVAVQAFRAKIEASEYAKQGRELRMVTE